MQIFFFRRAIVFQFSEFLVLVEVCSIKPLIDQKNQSLRISQASAQLNVNEMIPITALQKRGSLVWNIRSA
ncbi:hypothetical protein WB44_05840 [Synechococcus sp. WH 8020]|nr:hypothetical protein WB44_05840 [Synechococcus sp. WH 8020]